MWEAQVGPSLIILIIIIIHTYVWYILASLLNSCCSDHSAESKESGKEKKMMKGKPPGLSIIFFHSLPMIFFSLFLFLSIFLSRLSLFSVSRHSAVQILFLFFLFKSYRAL